MHVQATRSYEYPPESDQYPSATEVKFNPYELRQRESLLHEIANTRCYTRVIFEDDDKVVLLGSLHESYVQLLTKPKVLGAVAVRINPEFL